jgi:hypothetical protein
VCSAYQVCGSGIGDPGKKGHFNSGLAVCFFSFLSNLGYRKFFCDRVGQKFRCQLFGVFLRKLSMQKEEAANLTGIE